MDVNIFVTLFCFTLASVLCESVAQKCYYCTSIVGTDHADKECEDDFNKAGVPTIDCLRGCWKLKGEKDGSRYVQRMCAATAGGNDCVSQQVSGVEGNLCTCDTDYCNSALPTTVSMFGVLVTVFTLFYIMFSREMT